MSLGSGCCLSAIAVNMRTAILRTVESCITPHKLAWLSIEVQSYRGLITFDNLAPTLDLERV